MERMPTSMKGLILPASAVNADATPAPPTVNTIPKRRPNLSTTGPTHRATTTPPKATSVAYLTWPIVTGDVSTPWCLAVFGMVSPRKVWSRTFRSGGSGGGCAGSGPSRSGGAAVFLDLGEDRQQVLAELGVVLGDREVAELGHLPELGALDQLGELPCLGGRGVGVVFDGEQV